MVWRASLCIRHSADGKCSGCKGEIHQGSVYLACTPGKGWYNLHPECFAKIMWEVPEAVQAFEKCVGCVQEPDERSIKI